MTNYQQLRAERAVVEHAARRLRDGAIADGYAGLEYKHLAFGLASLLDELARHLRDLDDGVRRHVLEVSCQLLDEHSPHSPH